MLAANREALRLYGAHRHDRPHPARPAHRRHHPHLVVFGEADRIGDPDFGRAYAAAIPAATFLLVEGIGHLPEIETPDALIDVVWTFADRHATSRPVA